MSFTTTPNMSLQVPGVGTEAGPEYATEVNNDLVIIDGHNHASGSGVQITPAGLNINSTLTMGGNALSSVYDIIFQTQASPIPNAAPNIGCVYVSGNELYYNDYSGGHQVQITNNGSVNAGAGSITGLPSGTASVSFSASIYVFQSATNVAATVDVASVILRNTTPSSNGLTLSPPNSIGSNYSITLPSPNSLSQTGVLTYDTSNNIGQVTYDQVGEGMTSVGANAVIATSTITNGGTSAGIGQIAVTSSSGTFSSSSSSPTAVTNLVLSITTSGRPVMVSLQSDRSGNGSKVANAGGGTTNIIIQNNTSSQAFTYQTFGSVTFQSAISLVDFTVAGSPGTYQYQVYVSSFSGTSDVYYYQLVAFEVA